MNKDHIAFAEKKLGDHSRANRLLASLGRGVLYAGGGYALSYVPGFAGFRDVAVAAGFACAIGHLWGSRGGVEYAARIMVAGFNAKNRAVARASLAAHAAGFAAGLMVAGIISDEEETPETPEQETGEGAPPVEADAEPRV